MDTHHQTSHTSDNDLSLPQPDEVRAAADLMNRALNSMNRILLGRERLHRMVLIGLMSRGHLLLEGLPGLGKTAMIKALSQIMNLEFRRIQFTPDLMPSDILGAHILQKTGLGKRDMVYQPGPVFTNLLLADEINRASPKTQSAMLETMQECCVTLMGQTRPLPSPFVVLASQNPIELEGTYPLPEAQVDRFLFKVNVGDVEENVLEDIISTRRRGEPPAPDWRMEAAQLDQVFAVMDRIYLPRQVARYTARLVAMTHPNHAQAPQPIREYVNYGASPRAAIGMAEAARARALLD